MGPWDDVYEHAKEELDSPSSPVLSVLRVLVEAVLLALLLSLVFHGCSDKAGDKTFRHEQSVSKPSRQERIVRAVSELKMWEQTVVGSGWSSIVVLRVPGGWVVTDDDQWGCYVPEPKEGLKNE